MTRQQKLCAGCGTPLTFMSTPNFGFGYLKDGGRVCRNCFKSIARVHPSFGLRSRKDHTKDSIQGILFPQQERTRTTAGVEGPAEPGNDQWAEDPVPICLDALHTGKGKGSALEAARRAHQRWWAIDASEREHSMEELMSMLEMRAFVFGAVAAVYVWNNEFLSADKVRSEFIDHEGLWSGERREVVELFLIHLIFQQQWGRLDAAFERAEFRSAFLDYHDLYKSVQDPHYAFQSKQGPFLATVNKVNQYCRQIGREPLF